LADLGLSRLLDVNLSQILNDRFPMVTFPGFRVKKRFEDVFGTPRHRPNRASALFPPLKPEALR
jgi:hypothetical protein